MRHAQSADKQHGQTDIQRELTSLGIHQAAMKGKILNEGKHYPGIIVTSPATRAFTTASLVAEVLGLPEDRVVRIEDLYEASMRTFLKCINEFDDAHERILCVAHNPGVTYVAEFITGVAIDGMEPGGLIMIRLKVESWKDVGGKTGELM